MKMKNKENINLDYMKELGVSKIKVHTAKDLFKDLYDLGYIKSYLEKYFDGIYLISVNPDEIEKYYQYTSIYNIMNKYKQYSESQKMQFMFMKINEYGLKKKQETYEKMESLYWNIMVLDDSQYNAIVWYFSGSTWRNNQTIIKEIQKLIEVKTLEV